MAAGCGADKENAAPSPSATTASATAGAAAVSRRHGYAVKRCAPTKRPGRARWLGRVPLRDITNLIAAGSAAAELEALREQENSPPPSELAKPVAVLPAVVAVAAKHEVAGGAAAKAARYSFRKEFR